MPAGAARTPRGLPHRGGGLALLRALPQGEVARVALAARVRVGGVLHVLDALAGQLAVALPRAHVEVHVPGAVGRGVRVTAVQEPPDEREHLRDVARRARLIGGPADSEREVGGVEGVLEAVGQRPPRLLRRVEIRGLEAGGVGGGGAVEDLVVDVRHVADGGDPQPRGLEPADEHVEHDRAAHVPHVRHALHRGPAVVDRGLAGHEGLEVPDLRGAGVIEALGHGAASLSCVRESWVSEPEQGGRGRVQPSGRAPRAPWPARRAPRPLR